MTKTQAKQLLTMGNMKLSTKIATFDLPASQAVCGRTCAGCYAMKAQRMYPAVLPSRERKLEIAKQVDFPQLIVKAVQVLQPTYVRVHSSGEFFSQQYVDHWASIAKQLPKQVFYAYTKRLHEFDFTELNKLPNFVLINSLFGGRINYGNMQDKPSEMFLCPDTAGQDVRCGETCTYCMSKEAEQSGVYFVKH